MNDDLIEIENSFAVTLADILSGADGSQSDIARALGIPRQHLSEMKLGKRRCTAEYDLRFSRYFGTSPGFFCRLQLAYEMRLAKQEKGADIDAEVKPAA